MMGAIRKVSVFILLTIFFGNNSQTVSAANKNKFSINKVNYSLSLAEMIDAGKYDYVNGDINSNNFQTFLVKSLVQSNGKHQDLVESNLEVELVNFGRYMEYGDVLRELEERGLRPALLQELLAFGAKYKNKQRKSPIIALGSIWWKPNDNRYVAYLGKMDNKRILNLSWLDAGWNDYCRFLAVRK